MDTDKELKKLIKDNLSKELNKIEFKNKSRDKVLNRVSTKRSYFNRLLEYEIKIPLKPVFAIIVMFSIGIGYMTYPKLKVDETDILSSKIEVIYINERR